MTGKTILLYCFFGSESESLKENRQDSESECSAPHRANPLQKSVYKDATIGSTIIWKMAANNFEIAESVWWRNHHDLTVFGFEKEISKCSSLIKKFIENPLNELFVTGCRHHYASQYLHRVLTEEKNIPPTCTMEMMDHMLFRGHRKVTNLLAAFMKLFPVIFGDVWEEFDTTLVKSIHRTVMRGLLRNAGEYRTEAARPSGSHMMYLDPHLIEEEMESLCSWVWEEMKKSQEMLEQIKTVAVFLSKFLFIHPFSNGNGRVARLLASGLLQSITIVPVIFCSGPQYVQCLEESRSFKPTALARFLLESVHFSTRLVCVALDLIDE